MAIPRAVQAQADEADRLIKEGRERAQAGEQPPASPQATPGEPTTPAHGTADPVVETLSTKGLSENDPEFWKRRFVGVKQAYDEKVPELERKVSELEGLQGQLTELYRKNQALAEQLEALRANPQMAPEPTAPAAPSQSVGATDVKSIVDAVVTDEDREIYDDRFLDLLTRVANAVAAAGNQSVVKRVETIEQESVQTREERFWATIMRDVPDYTAINGLKPFQDWINAHDPVLGRVRDEVIQDNAAKLNAAPIVGLYQQFKQLHGIVTRVDTPTPKTDPREGMIDPDTGGSDDTPVEAPTWTTTQVSQFYNDCTRNKYSQAEMDRIDEQIKQAYRDGRVREG